MSTASRLRRAFGTPEMLGAAVAEERWLLAVVLSALNLFTLRVLMPLKQKAEEIGSSWKLRSARPKKRESPPSQISRKRS